MTTSLRWTNKDLDALPYEEGTRYEIIDGELYVAKQPHYHHQYVCHEIARLLGNWSKEGGGRVIPAPGVIFSEDNGVAPDVIWLSNERLTAVLAADGHFHAAPELIVEVLSPGFRNEKRDRVAKLQLYSRFGVEEYWIISWRARTIEVYRRESGDLRLLSTLSDSEILTSPLLPGFSCLVNSLFDDV
jgi:Uma2 family endonuclease